MRNEHSILTVSSVLQGQYGISDVAISVPTIVDRNGINYILDVPLSEEERQLLSKSAHTLKEILKELKL